MTTLPARVTAVVVAALTVLAVLTGCTPAGPSQEELEEQSDDARHTVLAIADQIAATFADLNPDLTFSAELRSGRARSRDCSNSPAATGEAIQWSSDYSFQVEPRQPTDRLVDPVVDGLIADGWDIRDDRHTGNDDIGRVVALDRDGYHITIAGERGLRDNYPSRVRFGVSSPCLVAPEG